MGHRTLCKELESSTQTPLERCISIFCFSCDFCFFSAGQNLLGEIQTEVREELAVRQKKTDV